MLASELKVGDWIKPTRCIKGHIVGPAVVTQDAAAAWRGNPEVRGLFDTGELSTHTIDKSQEVELCQSS